MPEFSGKVASFGVGTRVQPAKGEDRGTNVAQCDWWDLFTIMAQDDWNAYTPFEPSYSQ